MDKVFVEVTRRLAREGGYAIHVAKQFAVLAIQLSDKLDRMATLYRQTLQELNDARNETVVVRRDVRRLESENSYLKDSIARLNRDLDETARRLWEEADKRNSLEVQVRRLKNSLDPNTADIDIDDYDYAYDDDECPYGMCGGGCGRAH